MLFPLGTMAGGRDRRQHTSHHTFAERGYAIDQTEPLLVLQTWGLHNRAGEPGWDVTGDGLITSAEIPGRGTIVHFDEVWGQTITRSYSILTQISIVAYPGYTFPESVITSITANERTFAIPPHAGGDSITLILTEGGPSDEGADTFALRNSWQGLGPITIDWADGEI